MATLLSTWITTRAQLETAFKTVAQLPYGYMLKVADRTRTEDQNALLWPLLGEFEKQAELNGKKWKDYQWKSIFMEQLGHEQDFLPSLDGSRWFPAGLRSSKLSVKQFSDLIELIYATAAERGVVIEERVDG